VYILANIPLPPKGRDKKEENVKEKEKRQKIKRKLKLKGENKCKRGKYIKLKRVRKE
jgi:hypothetical protein